MSSSPVSIVKMDAAASGPSGQGSLVNIHLSITPPPSGWPEIFDTLWKQNFYMSKRRAHATNRHIVIQCMPEELQNDHLPQLKKIVQESNEAYGEAIARKNRQDQEQQLRDTRFRSGLNDLANGLDL